MPRPAPRAGVKRALDQDQLTLFYQPIHELESRRVVAAEALLRARRRTGEIRSATSIAAGAEEGPDLFRLDSWMMKQACEDAHHWQSNGGEGVRLNVNFSAREFQEGNVLPRLRKLVKGFPLMNVEITETAYIERPKQTMHILDALKEKQIEIWLDDYGTGHSSIEHLLRFPVDGVKIPGDFVKRIPTDTRALAIVRSTVALAHELGARVIAEGVEHQDQLNVLRKMKCDYIQGFLFSRPMSRDDFEELLTPPARTSTPRARTGRGGGRGRAGRSS
jgi:EAL domain-containing protein (putative c-di-GMP-specific phosphodiesterase class I)